MNNEPLTTLVKVMRTQAIKDAMYALRNADGQPVMYAYDALYAELETRLDADDFIDFIDSITFE